MDQDLLVRCARGESAAWDFFIRAHGATIGGTTRHTLRRVLGSVNEADAENVVQGVLLSLLQNGGRKLLTYEGRCDFDGWLRTVTTRFALNYIRSEKTGGTLRFRPLQDGPAAVAPALHADDVERLLHELKPVEKAVVKMFADGHPYDVISSALAIPISTVASHLHRARLKLKRASCARPGVSSGCDLPIGREAGASGGRHALPGRA